MNQEKKKALRVITEAVLQHVSDSNRVGVKGYSKTDDYFVLEAQIVVDQLHQLMPGKRVTTSKLVRIDIAKGEFETTNSLYRLIPRNLVEVYRMTDSAPAFDPDWARDPSYQWPHPLAPKNSDPRNKP
jgi:hypothetical protein